MASSLFKGSGGHKPNQEAVLLIPFSQVQGGRMECRRRRAPQGACLMHCSPSVSMKRISQNHLSVHALPETCQVVSCGLLLDSAKVSKL